ncbi:MAG: hypothetical protein IKU60_02325 [Clostridia bacterium]|nr:hypothetical protein [Clostridia bacterium]
MRIKVADFVFEINNKYTYCEKFLTDYVTKEEPHCSITVSDETIQVKKAKLDPKYPVHYIEFLEIYREICNYVIENGGILMHGAVIEYEGNAYMFTAPSGTGKTTHIRQWQTLYGDKVKIINGDKPLIRYSGDNFIAYGTPWCGKEHYNINASAPLKGIVLLSRGEENSIERISSDEFNKFLLKQIYLPKNRDGIAKVLDVADKLLTTVPLYSLKCNISTEAARVAMEGITK